MSYMQENDQSDTLALLLEEMNGPIEVGISASFDVGKDPAKALPLGTTARKRAAFIVSLCESFGISNVRLVAAAVAAAELVQKKELYDMSSNVKDVEVNWQPAEPKRPDLLVKVQAEYGKRAIIDGLLIIVATKVTFWQTNHHVGQGRMQGYFRKVMLKEFGDVPEDALLNVGWAIGHWASTRILLALLHVPDMETQVRFQIDPARDVVLRLSSLPAGCARMAFAIAAFVKLKSSIFSRFVPIPVGMANLIDNYARILEHPASYHVGHNHLSEFKPQVVSEVPDEIIEALSAFVHAVIPGSTLSKSRAAINEEAIRGHNWFVALQNARRRIQESNFIRDDQIEAALKEFTMGNLDVGRYNQLAERIEEERSLAVRRMDDLASEQTSVQIPVTVKPPVPIVVKVPGKEATPKIIKTDQQFGDSAKKGEKDKEQ